MNDESVAEYATLMKNESEARLSLEHARARCVEDLRQQLVRAEVINHKVTLDENVAELTREHDEAWVALVVWRYDHGMDAVGNDLSDGG